MLKTGDGYPVPQVPNLATAILPVSPLPASPFAMSTTTKPAYTTSSPATTTPPGAASSPPTAWPS